MIGVSSEMEEIAAELRASGARVSTQTCDVRRWEEVRALADHAVAAHGGLDIWVNNAGIGYIMKPLLEVSPDDWTAVIDVNLTGAFYGLRAAAEIMVAAGKGGRIINIASQAAKSGFPCAQAYTASKHGLVGLVRSAAIELGPHQITVNNVCPNHVTTGLGAWQNEYFANRQGKSVAQYLADMAGRIPLGRPGLPSDTANAVAFLCSAEASYITAESMNVSGGEEPH
jgi:meso-butanediol dehydrogenase/(S,S)-butanediol dehydrogenase/diacetyl reductase